jgi:hypothetical protein
MQKFFPIIFGFIYLRVPAGATIYMVVSSAMRIATQEVMFRTGMVTPVATEREIGSTKESQKPEKSEKEVKAEKPKPAPPKPTKRRSTATDGTSLGRGTVPPKAGAGSNGRGGRAGGNGRKPPGAKGSGQPDETASAKAQNRSRSKRTRKTR